MDRSAANLALAKAIAYVECGKPEQAADWLTSLVLMFQAEGVAPAIRDGQRVHPAPLLDAQDLSAAAGYLGRRLLR